MDELAGQLAIAITIGIGIGRPLPAGLLHIQFRPNIKIKRLKKNQKNMISPYIFLQLFPISAGMFFPLFEWPGFVCLRNTKYFFH